MGFGAGGGKKGPKKKEEKKKKVPSRSLPLPYIQGLIPPAASLPASLHSIPLFTTAAAADPGTSHTWSTKITVTISALTNPIIQKGYKPKPLPFKVANSIATIQARLVQRIQALEYVKMRELLPDNIALAERLAALPPGLAPRKPPGEREIGGDCALATWVLLFATYVAIVAAAHP